MKRSHIQVTKPLTCWLWGMLCRENDEISTTNKTAFQSQTDHLQTCIPFSTHVTLTLTWWPSHTNTT